MNVGPLAFLGDSFVHYQRNKFYEGWERVYVFPKTNKKRTLKFAPCVGSGVTPLEIMNILRVFCDFPSQRTYELLSADVTMLVSFGSAMLCYRRGRASEMSRPPQYTD